MARSASDSNRPSNARHGSARSAAAARTAIPLGSLTQRQPHTAASCTVCGSAQITQLALNLTDGTPVDFTSCHICAHKTWLHGGVELEVDDVLHRTGKAC